MNVSGIGELTVHGAVDEGYGPVADEFRANFERRGDLGAACAVYAGGRIVVDVWAGTADSRSGRPWARDTSAVIFSCSKGLLAICAYLLAQEGALAMDAPVARYWPEFARAGKEQITVRDVLAHRAGLPALDRDLSLQQVLGWDPVIAAIEDQPPLWPTGAGHFYHAMTYGWLMGEVVRRVTGLTPGRFLDARVARPLGLDTWIGIPASERRRVAWMEPALPEDAGDLGRLVAAAFEANPLIERSATMGAYPFPAADGLVTFNDPAIQAAEIPGANGISSARAMAKVYAACHGSVGDAGPLLTEASLDDALRPQSSGPQLSGLPDDGARWGTGFQLASPPLAPMLGPGSFGHAGAGGQLAFGDRDHGIGFCYLSNQMAAITDQRSRSLTAALRRVLEA